MNDTDQDEDEESRERRRRGRIAAAVVTELHVAGASHMAMLHDLSATGGLVLTRVRLAVGDPVEVRVHLGESLEETLSVEGRVVRVEIWAEGESFWPLAVAVHFDVPAVGHEKRLHAIAARQEELGLLPGKG